MHDIRTLRTNPAAFDAAMARRGLPPQSAAILAQDEARRTAQTQLQNLQSDRNALSKSIGVLKKKGEHGAADAAMAEVNEIKAKMAVFEAAEQAANAALTHLLETLPNLPFDDVPTG